MRIFQEEIFGPVLSVTHVQDIEDAIAIGNDTIYGLGAGVWSRNGNDAYRIGAGSRPAACGPTAITSIPAHAAFGGYKAFRVRPGEPQDDARPLPADQEPPGQLFHESDGAVLIADFMR